MKRYAGALLAIAVLAGLVIFAAFEVRKDRAEGKRATLEPIFPYGAAQVAEVALRSPDGEAVFRREGGAWTLVTGPPASDPGSVADFIGAWSRVRLIEVVDEAPRQEDLGRFGLDAPTTVVRARLVDPAASVTPGRAPVLEIGKPSPQLPALYARVDGFPRVVLVGLDALDLEKGIGRRTLGLESLLKEKDREVGLQRSQAPVAP